MRLPTTFLILGLFFAFACDRPQASRQPPAPPAVPTHATVQLPSGRTIADVVQQVTPSVVSVFSDRDVQGIAVSPHFRDPMFERFFGSPNAVVRGLAPHIERNLGSGVIVRSDGVILTNHHVVASADRIRIVLEDGRELDAKLVGTDPDSDVAVLRVDEKHLPAIEIADSSKIRVGDLVLAVGNPFGLGQAVTMGIISATGRANVGIIEDEDFIQTDAAINPGNSGGALVDMDGKLVGINAMIASLTGGFQGIGFAIPSNMAMQVERAILAHGEVTRSWLGIGVQDAPPPDHGVVVSDVERGSPADRSGIRRGDMITLIDSTPVSDAAQLRNFVALAGKDTRVKVHLERARVPMTIEVTLAAMPSDHAGATQALDRGMLSGVTIRPVAPAEHARLGVPENLQGLMVTRVQPGSPAAHLGVREDDVIIAMNRTPTPTPDTLRAAGGDADRAVVLLVVRHGAAVYLSLSR